MKFDFDSANLAEVRAVQAAINALLGEETVSLRLPTAVVDAMQAHAASETAAQAPTDDQIRSAGGEPATQIVITEAVTDNRQDRIPVDSDLDSAGQPWSAELHSSSRAKVADGTWKKKRGAGKAEDPVAAGTRIHESFENAVEVQAIEVPLPPATSNGEYAQAAVPPIPPAPPAAALVTMNQIWALIPTGKTTLDKVLDAVRRMGFADLGAVAQTATAEQRAALLTELTERKELTA